MTHCIPSDIAAHKSRDNEFSQREFPLCGWALIHNFTRYEVCLRCNTDLDWIEFLRHMNWVIMNYS